MQSLLSMACLMACLGTLGPHIAAAQEEQPATGFALWILHPGCVKAQAERRPGGHP